MKGLRVAAAAALITAASGTGFVIHHAGADSGSPLTAITPCRLIDTRPAPYQVGERATPLGPGEVLTIAVAGAHGNSAIPADAVGISANLTITNPTADGFLTLYPAGGARPNASNINWVAGQAPTANQAVIGLTGGAIDTFNYDGTVDVIIDVHGYYSSATGMPGATGETGATGAQPSAGTQGSLGPLATATAYGRVAAFKVTPTVVGSVNVSGAYRSDPQRDFGPAAGSVCITFNPPIPPERLRNAVVGGFYGENLALVTNPNRSCKVGELGVRLFDPYAADGGAPKYGSFMFLVP